MGPAWEVNQSHWLEFPRLSDFLSGEGRGRCRHTRPGPTGPLCFPPSAAGPVTVPTSSCHLWGASAISGAPTADP